MKQFIVKRTYLIYDGQESCLINYLVTPISGSGSEAWSKNIDDAFRFECDGKHPSTYYIETKGKSPDGNFTYINDILYVENIRLVKVYVGDKKEIHIEPYHTAILPLDEYIDYLSGLKQNSATYLEIYHTTDDIEFIGVLTREETNSEYFKRVKSEEEQKKREQDWTNKQDLEEYERLKNKLGK